MAAPTQIAQPGLSAPVSVFAQFIEPLNPEDSVAAAARDMAEQGAPVVPVVSGHSLVGAVSEIELLNSLANGADDALSVGKLMNPSPPTIESRATGYEALRRFEDTDLLWLIVIDQRGEPVGILTPSRLYEPRHDRSFRGRIGGMATPFGVYLTNGIVSGGASGWALVATGALMSLVFHIATTIALAAVTFLPQQLQNTQSVATASQLGGVALFFLGLRAIPLSGTHGAEHMVVHAIERGEELKEEIVARMPRVHPRCGTNLAVAAMMFLGVMSIEAIPDQEVRLLLATLATLILWQPLGSLMQLFVTTKKPSPVQITGGIHAGQQLLERSSRANLARPTFVSRVAMSGLLQVLVGGTGVALLFALVYEVLRVPVQFRVS